MSTAEREQTDGWAVGNARVGLFSSLLPAGSPIGNAATPTTIVRIDPVDGAETALASVALPAYWGLLDFAGNPQAAIYDDVLYLIGQSGPANSTTLYRVALPGTP